MVDFASNAFPLPTVQYEMVTPQTAQAWLIVNRNNRNLRSRTVNQYARDMIEGRWTANNDAITFDWRGELRNGQHRLHAVIQSGRSFRMLVQRGLSPDAIQNLDAGAKRTAADALRWQGHENSSTLAAIANFAVRIAEGRAYKAREYRSTAVISDFVQKYPEIIDSVHVAVRYKKRLAIPQSVVGCWHWWVKQPETEQFLERLSKLVGEPEGSPILALDRRLRVIKDGNIRFEPDDYLALVIKGWNRAAAGQTIQVLTLTSTDDRRALIYNPAKWKMNPDA